MTGHHELILRFDQHAGSAKQLADNGLRPSAEFWYGCSLAFRIARNNLRQADDSVESLRHMANTWEAVALDARMEASCHERRAVPDLRAYYLGVAEGLENAAQVLRDAIFTLQSGDHDAAPV